MTGMIKKAWKALIQLLTFSKDEPKKRKPRKKRDEEDWTLASLLERLEQEVGRYELKQHKYTNITNRDFKALRKMGPYVLPPLASAFKYVDDQAWREDRVIDMKMPALVFVGFHERDSIIPVDVCKDDKEIASPIHIFAIRQDDTPVPGIEKTPGVRYVCGVGYAFSDRTEFNMATYVTVDNKTGRVHVPRVFNHETVKLPDKSCYTRPSFGIWNSAGFAKDGVKKRSAIEKSAQDIISCWVGSAFVLWANRQQYYQVSARKKKARITFCVAPGDQVSFFKDRDKTAIARDGKRKRIVHYVRSHDRELSNGKIVTVSEHLRGIRRFHWEGYDIAVSVPKFHILGLDFDVAPIDVNEAPPGVKTLTTKQVAAKLAKIEDTETYRHGEQA